MSFSKTRIADTLHKSLVTVLLGVSVVGLVDIGLMHRNLMSAGKEALAAKEIEDLRNLRDTASTQGTPFPEGTDLHSASNQR